MADLSVDDLFDAAVRIQLLERSIVVSFDADNTIRIKFPITRRFAEFLGIPHYLILRSFALMEQENLVTKAERAGIVTTGKGSRKMIGLMRERYQKEAEGILGKVIFQELLKKIHIGIIRFYSVFFEKSERCSRYLFTFKSRFDDMSV